MKDTLREELTEKLGRVVRQAWVDYCVETGRTDEYHRICPWEELDDWSKEVDRRIGIAVHDATLRYLALSLLEVHAEERIKRAFAVDGEVE